MEVTRNGRKRNRPSSISSRSSADSRKRRKASRAALYKELNESDTESVDDVASMEGSEDSWGADSLRNSRLRRLL